MFGRCTLAVAMLASAPAFAGPKASGPPKQPPVATGAFEGPDRSEIDILRPQEGFPRIFVQATLPDGSRGLFLVDTGADVSVLQRSTAERLGLEVQEGWSTVEGLSGRADVGLAVMPELTLGEMTVDDIEFAVDVRGLSDTVEFMPLDGLLGNNVWSRFVLEIDYPADLLVLHRPGTVKLPRKQEMLFFDGRHVFSPVTVTTAADPPSTHTLIAQVDTGAGQLMLCAATGLPFQDDYTEGVEELRGIGASETLPPYRFLETTRRVAISKVELGGARYDLDTSARWVAFDDLRTDRCAAGMRALLGHEYLAGHRVFFDYHGARLSLTKSRRKARQLNGHQVLLEQDVAERGETPPPDRVTYRAKLMIGGGDLDEARALLSAHLDAAEGASDEELAERRVLLARIHRHKGDLDAAWDALRPLSAADLVAQGEITATVNGLLFERRADEARALAEAAVAADPEDGWARVALADVLIAQDDPEAARAELLEAARIEGFPEAHLLRRARVALAHGDRYGAMAHVRKLIQLYPFGGEFLWFYALLIGDDGDADTFRHDMHQAMARLHPERRPVDFQVAAHHALGEQEQALALMKEGIARHCAPMEDHGRDNCLAWFQALAHHDLDEALTRITRALNAEGPRSDYLDTAAMVHLARGDLQEAFDAAWAAARLSPDDVYMLWQAERIGDLLNGRDPVTSSEPRPTPGAVADGPLHSVGGPEGDQPGGASDRE